MAPRPLAALLAAVACITATAHAADLAGARPTVEGTGLHWQGRPVYLAGVWIGGTVSTDPRLYKPQLDGQSPAYARLLSAETAPLLGINSAHPPMSQFPVSKVLGWIPENPQDAARYDSLQSFVKGLGDMPVTVDCAGIAAFGSEEVPSELKQVGPGWHGFVPLCPEHPQGRGVYEAYWKDCARQIVEAGSNAVIYELCNEPAYNCRCRYNKAEFAQRMERSYGGIDAANARWHTEFSSFAAVANLEAPDATPALWCDWCEFIGDRYVEFISAGKSAIASIDSRPLYFTDQPSVGTTYLRCNGIDPVKVSAFVDVVGMEGGVRFGYSKPRGEADPMATVLEAGEPLSHPLYLDMARAFGKPVVNTETYCGRFYENVRFPSHRQDICTELWEEMIHGAGGSYLYNWGRRWWEWQDIEGAKRVAREVGYKAFSMLNPYAYPPESLQGFADFSRDMELVGDSILRGPRIRGQVALLISQPSIRQTFRAKPYTEAGPYEQVVRAWYTALTLRQVPVDVIWEEQLPRADLSAYRAIVAPGADHAYRGSAAPLRAYAEAGGQIIATPEAFSKDQYDEPLLAAGDDALPVRRVDDGLSGDALAGRLMALLLSGGDFRLFSLAAADDTGRPLLCEAYRIERPEGDYYYLVNWETTSRLVRLAVPGAVDAVLSSPLDGSFYSEGDISREGVLLHLPSQVRTLVLLFSAAPRDAHARTEADVRSAHAEALAREVAELEAARQELEAERALSSSMQVSMGGPLGEAGEYLPDDGTVLLLHFDGDLGAARSGSEGDISFTEGKFGSQALHTGPDARVQVPLGEGYDPRQGTIECWARPDWPAADGERHTLVEMKGPGEWNQNRLVIYKNLDYEVAFCIYDANHRALAAKVPINVLRAGQWTHLAGVWNATTGLKLYVNGQLQAEARGEFHIDGLDSLAIGATWDGTRPWVGTIEELRLSAVERQATGDK